MSGSDKTGLHEFVVVRNELVAQDVWRMTCRTSVAEHIRAGQFVNVAVPGDGSHILRVPLSFSEACHDSLTMEYAVVGEGTDRLSCMLEGDVSTMVGPCGKGWEPPRESGRALLIAGGIGLPPIVACARMLASKGIGFDAIVGAQTASRLITEDVETLRGLAPEEGCDCARRVTVTTDDGSIGIAGFTTDVMDDLLGKREYGQVYACGPQGMLAGVARLSARTNTPCQVSLERMMGCGFGACSCCNVALRNGGYALCCSDGPVFDAEEVAW